MAFADDGKTLVTGGWDKVARLWDLATGKEIYQFQGLNSVTSVAFAAGGRMVAVADSWPKSRIHLYDTATGVKLHQFQGHDVYVGGLSFSPDGKFLTTGQRDTMLLTWDLTPARRAMKTPRENLNPQQLAQLWKVLAENDVQKAQEAVWTLTASPDRSLPFLNQHLQSIKRTGAERIKKLIDELDSKRFQVRQRAAKELARLDVEAEPALRRTLKGKPSLEVRLRVKALIANIGQWRVWSNQELRHVRAVHVLERIGSEESLRILSRLAKGAPGAMLTREANTARKRLQRR